MLPSATVENYLKAILKAQSADGRAGRARSDGTARLGAGRGARNGDDDGQDARRVGAGAIRALCRRPADASGEKLAALVLRRHRLIELFLVKVMGMSWTEVHDEAEHLEHAVSDRLIDRIDEMLGRPAVDPHGDPIPDPDGTVSRTRYDTLLTCPLHTAGDGPARQRSGSASSCASSSATSSSPDRSIEVEAARRRGRQRAAARRQPSARSRLARAPRRRCSCRPRASWRCS